MIPTEVLDRLQAWFDGEEDPPAYLEAVPSLIAFYRTWARYERAFDTFRDQIACDMLEGGHLAAAPATSAEIDPTPCNECGLVKCVDPSVCEEPLRPKRKPWEGIPMPDEREEAARFPDSLRAQARVDPPDLLHSTHPTDRSKTACGVPFDRLPNDGLPALASATRCASCACALADWHEAAAARAARLRPSAEATLHAPGNTVNSALLSACGIREFVKGRITLVEHEVDCTDCLAELYGTVHGGDLGGQYGGKTP